MEATYIHHDLLSYNRKTKEKQEQRSTSLLIYQPRLLIIVLKTKIQKLAYEIFQTDINKNQQNAIHASRYLENVTKLQLHFITLTAYSYDTFCRGMWISYRQFVSRADATLVINSVNSVHHRRRILQRKCRTSLQPCRCAKCLQISSKVPFIDFWKTERDLNINYLIIVLI